jgi:polyferredoxin
MALTGFYILLYFFPAALGLNPAGNTGLIGLFDPMSIWIKNHPASQWFVYGVFYTVAILAFGIKFLMKYRSNKYQRLRTLSVMFFQLCFAFTIPEILSGLNQPSMDLKNMWPLNYYFFFDWNLENLINGGTLGIFMLVWGILLIVLISPVLTYFYGKRWYCSWVCGCGGLAETAGDPFRHLSDKSLKAWKIERWLVHSVLVLIVVVTFFVLYTYFTGNSQVLFLNSYTLREWYGFYIGAIFSGVIGVGFYPLMGSRVWCRFGCPMAAILGIQQKFFSRFRITTNGGQCISCGNCSAYCEMGIDVRHYAQRGQNIVRASCVGCGICAAVCPRGVLKLENGSLDIHERTSALKVLKVNRGGVSLE